MVVLYHARLPIPGGFTGVDVFFVVSGFVIARMLLRERLTGDGISIARFFARRFKRLSPALSVMVTSILLASIVLASPFGDQQSLALTAMGAILLAANVVIARTSGGYFDAPAEANALLNTWSLSVEEQFYLFFPLILFVAWRLEGRGRRWRQSGVVVIGSVLVVSMASAVLIPVLFPAAESVELLGFYSPLSRAWEFAVGALLALRSPLFTWRSRSPARVAGWTGIVLLLLSAFTITKATTFPGPATILPVAGTLLLLVSGTDTSSYVTRILSLRPLRVVGDLSYSLYLWHWPAIVLATEFVNDSRPVILIAVAVSVVPAVVSYRFVEMPLRRASWSGAPVWSRAIGLSLGVPLLVASVVLVGATQRWWIEWDSNPTRDELVASEHCIDAPFDSIRCSWQVEGAVGEVLLVGDSQALVFADGVVGASNALNLNVVVSARSGCPFLTIESSGTKPLDCPSWQRQMLDYIVDRNPEVVIVANRSVGYTNPQLAWRTFVDSEGRPLDAETAQQVYGRSLEEMARILEVGNSQMLIVQNTPELRVLRRRNSIGRRMLLERPPPTFDASETLSLRGPISELERSVAARFANVAVFDPAEHLCSDAVCELSRRGESLYLDGFHLSRFGSLELQDTLRTRIASLIPRAG